MRFPIQQSLVTSHNPSTISSSLLGGVDDGSTGRQLSSQRARLCSIMDVPPILPTFVTRATVHRRVRHSRKFIQALLRNANTLRDHFLEARSQHYAAINNQDAATILRNMRQVEANWQMYARFCQLMGKTSSGALSSLRVPNPNDPSGAYITLYDPQEIESHLLARNQEHFSQATGTPFTVPPLTHIGRNADHGIPGALAALYDATDEVTIALLEQTLAYKLPDTSCNITTDDTIAKFQRWKETTSTSRNGNHLGHYKALLVPDPLPTLSDGDDSSQQSEDSNRPIFDVMATLLAASFCCGLVADRWPMVFGALIEKIPGNPVINKLRVIHLFDSLWNLGLGVLWSRRLLPQTEHYETINKGQWGSCKSRRAIDCVAIKEFTYKISRYTCTNLVTFDNDAKSCYDRIVMSYALLRCQQLGLTALCALALGHFLDNARYHIKTQLGAIPTFYCNGDDGILQHGPGQGSLEGPPLWAIDSSGPMVALCARFTGLCFEDPDSQTHARSPIQGFVDDVGLATNQFCTKLQQFRENSYHPTTAINNLRTLLHDASAMAQWWEQLLWSTGGKLEVPKCFIYVMHWAFNAKGEAILMPQADLVHKQCTVSLIDSESQQPTPIAVLDCTTPSRTLGVHVIPAGNSSGEAQRLLLKSRNLGTRLKTAGLTSSEGFSFYRSIYRPSLFYTLPISYLTVREGDAIMAASTSCLLNACGFHRNFPWALTFTCKSHGGLGFSHIYDEQGCQHLCTILLHHLCSSSGQLHDFLLILYRWVHLVCGFQQPPPLNITLRAPHLPSGWLASTCQYLRYTGASVWTTPDICPHLHLRRQHDRILMEHACASPLSDRAVCCINCCRHFLQVECLSDLCTLMVLLWPLHITFAGPPPTISVVASGPNKATQMLHSGSSSNASSAALTVNPLAPNFFANLLVLGQTITRQDCGQSILTPLRLACSVYTLLILPFFHGWTYPPLFPLHPRLCPGCGGGHQFLPSYRTHALPLHLPLPRFLASATI